MWDFLAKLPPILSFSIIVLLIIALLIIVLKGKIKAKVGDKEVDVGADTPQKEPDKPLSTDTATIEVAAQKRSCGDCLLIMMGEREKYEIKMNKETDRILKTQMTFAEQKLIDIQIMLLNAYSDTLYSVRSIKNTDPETEAVQHKLFYGLLKDALLLVKDEIRRSLKENGFFELDGSGFSFYVKDKEKTLVSLMEQHLRNLYPDRGVVLNVQDVLKLFGNRAGQIEEIVFEMYTYSKNIKVDADLKMKELKTQFGAWIDSFIK